MFLMYARYRNLLKGRWLDRAASLLQAATLFMTTAALLSGCGGGGSTGSGRVPLRTARARGIVQLPAGLSVVPATLTAAAPNATAIGADGAFQFDKVAGGDSLVVVATANHTPLLAGFSDASDTVQVNAATTAVALLFFGSGAFTLPPEQHAHVRELFAATPAAAGLAATLAQRLAADPRALLDRDPQLQAAIQTALDLLSGKTAMASSGAPGTRSFGRAASPKAIVTHVTRDAGGITLLLAQPSEPQSGVIVGASDDLTGLQITNTRRRNLLYFITQTGYIDAQGVSHVVNLPVAQGKFPANWIASTNKLAGAVGSAVEALRGNSAYTPVQSPVIPLPLSPATARQSFYRVTVAGPGVATGTDPKEGAGTVGSAAFDMAALGFVKDIMLPLLFTAMDVHLSLSELANQPALLSSSKGLMSIISGGGHVALGATNFEAGEVARAVFKTMTDDSTFRQAILSAVIDTMQKQGVELGTLLAADFVLTKLNFVQAVLDKGLALGDVSVTVSDWRQSNYFDEWNITAVPATVRINPDGATVYNLDTQALTAQTQVTGSLTYHWTTSAAYGSLADTKPNAGNGSKDLTTTSATINYVGDKNPPAGDGLDETVTVEVYRIPTGATQGQKQLVGKATATLHRKLRKQVSIPTTLVFDNFADLGDRGNLAVSFAVPVQAGADNYVFSVTSQLHQYDATYTIKAADIGPSIPDSVPLSGNSTNGVQAVRTSGATGLAPIFVYRRGDVLIIPVTNLPWGAYYGTTRAQAIADFTAQNPTGTQWNVTALANF